MSIILIKGEPIDVGDGADEIIRLREQLDSLKRALTEAQKTAEGFTRICEKLSIERVREIAKACNNGEDFSNRITKELDNV